MGSLLKRSLIFIGIMVAGLAFYAVRFNMIADNFDETAIPYLNKAIPKLASWQYDELEPLLSPQAREIFKTDEGRAGYQRLTKLGRLSKIEKPQYQSDTADHTEALGDIRLISYTIPADFDTGPAIIKIKLASTDEAYYIHQFGIHSEIFAEAQ